MIKATLLFPVAIFSVFCSMKSVYSQCGTSTAGSPGFSQDCSGLGANQVFDVTLSSPIPPSTATTVTFNPVTNSCDDCARITITVRSLPDNQLRYTHDCGALGNFCNGGAVSFSYTTGGTAVTGYRYIISASEPPFCGVRRFGVGFSGPGATSSTSSPPAGCSSTTSHPNYRWTGCASTNWFDPCNWSTFAIPTTTGNVTIPNTTRKPLISSGTANCYDINIQSSSGARLDITGGTLNITKP